MSPQSCWIKICDKHILSIFNHCDKQVHFNELQFFSHKIRNSYSSVYVVWSVEMYRNVQWRSDNQRLQVIQVQPLLPEQSTCGNKQIQSSLSISICQCQSVIEPILGNSLNTVDMCVNSFRNILEFFWLIQDETWWNMLKNDEILLIF